MGGLRERWRWSANTYYTKQHTISVIEPPDVPQARPSRKGEPFGFSRVLDDGAPSTRGLLEKIERGDWEVPFT